MTSLSSFVLVLIASIAHAKTEGSNLGASDGTGGMQCNSQQSQCCMIDMAVKKCKAAMVFEGQTPEMTANESEAVMGSNDYSMLNCLVHEKVAGHWKSAQDECQKWLGSCIQVCGQPHAGSWPAEACQNAMNPLLSKVGKASADSKDAVAESRDTLKAITGGDDAYIDQLLG